jgi:2,4-dienoyl-CoA reductase-like NADH-dependent reductase (Old Yellow Enzyme family)
MLYQPLEFRCGAHLSNRVALAPLTNLQSAADGQLGDDEAGWLARRADGGFGLLETCAAYVAQDGKSWEGQLGIDRDELVPGLARLATRLKLRGGLAVMQLFHGGSRADAAVSGTAPWSTSSWSEETPGFVPPRAATTLELETVITRFADAAMRAERAGFDGIELHGAHGYLLSQALSRTMNLRGDEWGGDLAGRARLIRQVTRAVRARVGPRFVVGVRLSLEDFGQARGLDLDESLQVAAWLADDGVDFVHASLWDVSRNTGKRPEQHPLPLLRAELPREVAIIACGKIWTAAEAESALARGADVVALGRAAILNPDWPAQAKVPGWQPLRPPMSKADLAARAVSPRFVEYLTRWKGLVADG